MSIIKCLYFFISTIFLMQRQKFRIFFISFSEVSWPVICVMACQTEPCEGWWLANMKKGILGLLHNKNMPIIVETIFVNFLFSSSQNFEPSDFWIILPIKAFVLFTCKIKFAKYTVGRKKGTSELFVVHYIDLCLKPTKYESLLGQSKSLKNSCHQ